MTRIQVIEAAAESMAMWGNIYGPQARRLAKIAIERLEHEGAISFAEDDFTGL